jgi:hypothetical protein
MSYGQGGKAPRIIFHHLRGMTVREIAARVGCCETWAQFVISTWDGHDEFVRCRSQRIPAPRLRVLA